MQQPLRIAFIGWGAICRRVAELLRVQPNVVIAAVGVRDASVDRPDLPAGARLVDDPAGLSGLDLDLVIEAAGRSAVGVWGEAALRNADGFVVSSTSAFCDGAELDRLLDLARHCGSRVMVAPGALGGIDALAAASQLPLETVEHTIAKPPSAWRGTPAEAVVALDEIGERTVFFTGSAREAASRFPQNANAAVISALAGIGLDLTRVLLVADPDVSRNSHRLIACGAFGRLDVLIENRPLENNPKSSEMTALNLVRLIRQRTCPLVL